MSFLFGTFLFALAAIAIPVIIHLFSFRRYKRVLFPNIRFLQEITKETQSQAKLRHLLVLLCRVLAISFLVLAFAQPFIPSTVIKKEFKGDNIIGIYIDNSFSMQSENSDGKLIEQALVKVNEIISAHKGTDRFILTTNDFHGRHQRIYPADEIPPLLEEVTLSPTTRTLFQVITHTTGLMPPATLANKAIYVLSDFQKGFTDFEKIIKDTTVTFFLLPLTPEKTNNLYIDSCWFYSPVHQIGKTEKFFARVKNTSENNLEDLPLKLIINGKQKALASFSVSAHSPVTVELSYTITEPGIQSGFAEINDSPILYDNRFYFSFDVMNNISVFCISEDSASVFINALYGKGDFSTLAASAVNSIDYSKIPNYNLIVLSNLKAISTGLSSALKEFTGNGGSIIVFPSPAADVESYNSFFSLLGDISHISDKDTAATVVSTMNLEHEMLSDVFEKVPENIDLPRVNFHYPLLVRTRTLMETLLTLQNGDIFLSRYRNGNGYFYVCASPLGEKYSNFPKHALFVPLLYKIALFSQPVNPLYYTLGSGKQIAINPTLLSPDNPVHLQSIGDEEKNVPTIDIIPELKNFENFCFLDVHEQVGKAGNYTITSAGKTIAGASFNYNRIESDPDCYTEEELKSRCAERDLNNFSLFNDSKKSIASAISEMNDGTPLWKYCILLALIFLGGEVLLLRFLK